MTTDYPALAVVNALQALLAHLDALTAERDALARWKSEAMPVMDGLQELGKALGIPLGHRITGPDALASVDALTAERDRLRDRLQRVEALADKWEAEDTCSCGGCATCTRAEIDLPRLRAALEGQDA